MGKTKSFHLKLPENGVSVLEEIAKKEDKPLASIVRLALEEYAAKKGYNISFTVDHGGYRKREGK